MSEGCAATALGSLFLLGVLVMEQWKRVTVSPAWGLLSCEWWTLGGVRGVLRRLACVFVGHRLRVGRVPKECSWEGLPPLPEWGCLDVFCSRCRQVFAFLDDPGRGEDGAFSGPTT